MEAGESPARSRHCKEESLTDMSLGESLGRREEMRSPSQENYLPMNHREGSRDLSRT